MKADVRGLALVLASAACGRQAPTPAPMPAPVPPVAVPALDSAVAASRPAGPIAVPDSDVTRQAVAVFGDSVTPPGADSADTDGPTWDIDVRSYEAHQRVEYYVTAFTGSARERFVSRLERGSRYEPMIREKLRAANIPEDMYYLALVESGFDNHAYSRAAAVGMWQFMTRTARGVGLKVDWWVDERRDPVRSTEGAVKFLGWLREQFGSLYLAAAAYNGGPGRIARGLSRLGDDVEDATGDDAFFALAESDYLRGETKNYVPQLIAAALVAKEPARYGLTLRTLPPFLYDTVIVPGATPLAAVAKAAGVPLDTIRELNPQILRGTTPPSGRHRLRVPLGTAAGFVSAFAALDAKERASFTRVTTKKGQTLTAIATKAGVTTRQLRWYNPNVATLKSGRLRPGQTVLVPARAVVAAARDVPNPAVEIYGSSRTRSGARVHVVKRGETLSGIAKRYGTTVRTLMRLNGLKKSVIYAGQTIVVRRAPAAASRKASTTASRSASPRRAGTAAAKRPTTRSAAPR